MFSSEFLYKLIIGMPAFLLSLSIHEYAHAKVADLLGDPTARWMGRLTLNPISHIDPIGLLMLIFARIGWAKPVPVNPTNFRDVKKGMLWVGLAGPLANIGLAVITAIIIHIFIWSVEGLVTIFGSYTGIIFNFLYILLFTNLGLAIFNLLPFPPLDGSKVLAGLLPRKHLGFLHYLEGPAGRMIIILLALSGMLGNIISPIISFLVRMMGL